MFVALSPKNSFQNFSERRTNMEWTWLCTGNDYITVPFKMIEAYFKYEIDSDFWSTIAGYHLHIIGKAFVQQSQTNVDVSGTTVNSAKKLWLGSWVIISGLTNSTNLGKKYNNQ